MSSPSLRRSWCFAIMTIRNKQSWKEWLALDLTVMRDDPKIEQRKPSWKRAIHTTGRSWIDYYEIDLSYNNWSTSCAKNSYGESHVICLPRIFCALSLFSSLLPSFNISIIKKSLHPDNPIMHLIFCVCRVTRSQYSDPVSGFGARSVIS
jgi:hypothetical protein